MNSIGKKTSPKKVTCADIRSAYSPSKAQRDLTSATWVYFVLRPISFYVTPFFVNARFSANAVTLLGLIPILAGGVFLLLGSQAYYNFIIGAVLINLWSLSDVIDGNIARYYGKASKYGELLDWFIGRVWSLLVPTTLGLGLYWSSLTGNVFDFGLGMPAWGWLAMAQVQIVATFYRMCVSMRGRQIIGERIAGRVDKQVSFRTVLPRAVTSLECPLLFVAAVAGWLGVFFAFYSLYSLAVFVVMTCLAFQQTKRADRQG